MYQAFYRKYRPRTFSEVTGQDHITVTLRRQIVSGRQSHAYLFVGTRGTGKTTCAKVLSRAINCQNPEDGDPCNKCSSCVGIENGSILDVLEIDAASNNGVDDVRALREEAIYSPAALKKRVYIIDEVHMLSNSAFNALLKILEEPPEHLVFILATTALHKVPATILSRCQRFSFKRLSVSDIAARLNFVAEKEGITLTSEAADMLSTLADGSMRDALSLLDQCASEELIDLARVLDTIGLVGRQEVLGIAEAAGAGDVAAALGILDGLYSDGRDMSSLLSELGALMRDTLVHKISPDSPLLSGGFSRAELSALSEKLSQSRLFSCLDIIRETVLGVSRGGNTKLTVEMCLIRLCDERLSQDNTAILARIERLESADFREQGSGVRGQGSGVRDFREQGSGIRDQETPPPTPNSSLLTPNSPPTPNSSLLTPNSPTESSQLSTLNSQLPKDEGFWSGILEFLKSDMSIYSLMSDESRVQAEMRDNVLTVRAGDLFTVGLIESKKFFDPLTDAARKVFGRDVMLRVELAGFNGGDSKVKKIDELNKFSLVKFE